MLISEVSLEKDLQERLKHIDVDSACIERGGNSTVHRGVLAQYLNTNIPTGIDLCHYCGNGSCSNPKHLYWGSRKENVADSVRHGTWSNSWDRLVGRVGIEAAKEHMRNIADPSKAGSGNKGKSKKRKV